MQEIVHVGRADQCPGRVVIFATQQPEPDLEIVGRDKLSHVKRSIFLLLRRDAQSVLGGDRPENLLEDQASHATRGAIGAGRDHRGQAPVAIGQIFEELFHVGGGGTGGEVKRHEHDGTRSG